MEKFDYWQRCQLQPLLVAPRGSINFARENIQKAVGTIPERRAHEVW
jgi:hypothetical protein